MTDDTVSNQRRLPDPEKCRTTYLGQALDLSECLMENPDDCEFAVSFGFGVYCYHSDQRRFEKTDRRVPLRWGRGLTASSTASLRVRSSQTSKPKQLNPLAPAGRTKSLCSRLMRIIGLPTDQTTAFQRFPRELQSRFGWGFGLLAPSC